MCPPKHTRVLVRSLTSRCIPATFAILAATCFSAYGQTSIRFSETIDFSEFGFEHGSVIDPNAYTGFQFVSPEISVTPPSGTLNRAVVFDTNDSDVIAGTPDPDLVRNGSGNRGIRNFHNVAIIQENTSFTITNDRIDDPIPNVNDHRNGGTFRFDLNPGADVTVDTIRVDLIDIESADQIRIVAFDDTGSFTWTGADLVALDNTIVFGEASANRTSLLTARDAGLTSINRFDIISTTSFAVDNIHFRGVAVPEVSSSFLTAGSVLLLCFRRRRQS